MTKSWLSVLVLFVSSSFVAAQVHHRAPSSPAFILAGSQPTQVLQPSSVSDVYAGVLSNFDDQGNFTPDIGIELAPYWLKSRPSLSWEEYNNPTLGQSILQSFQLSTALVEDTVFNRRQLGLGARVQLFNGRPGADYLQLNRERLDQNTMISIVNAARANEVEFSSISETQNWLIRELSERFSQAKVDRFKEVAETIQNEFQPEEIQAYLLKLMEELSENEIYTKAATASRQRVGFFLELAGGTSFYQPNFKADPSYGNAGFWITTSYITDKENQWTLTLRLLDDDLPALRKYDAGFSYGKSLEKLQITTEAIFRYYESTGILDPLEEDQLSYRLAANLNYYLSDQIFVNLSLGKDHDTPFNYGGFFSVFGVNLDIFSQEILVDQLPE